MNSGIYKINFPNGKCYIGMSNDIDRRLKEHNQSSKNSHLPVHRAIALYGKVKLGENVEILESIKPEDRILMSNREQYWIEYFSSNQKNKGYNLTIGGDGASTGVYNISAKLNEQQIEEVYSLLQNAQNVYIYEIAEKYGMSSEAISEINCGKRYYNSKLSYPLRPDTKFKIGQTVPKGVNNHLSKFTQEDIDKIYDLLANSVLSLRFIAEEFNVSYTTISKINRGISYIKEEYEYPIRKGFTANKKIDNEILKKIILDIQNSSLSLKKLSIKYKISYDTILRINKGEGVYRKEEYVYPLR